MKMMGRIVVVGSKNGRPAIRWKGVLVAGVAVAAVVALAAGAISYLLIRTIDLRMVLVPVFIAPPAVLGAAIRRGLRTPAENLPQLK